MWASDMYGEYTESPMRNELSETVRQIQATDTERQPEIDSETETVTTLR